MGQKARKWVLLALSFVMALAMFGCSAPAKEEPSTENNVPNTTGQTATDTPATTSASGPTFANGVYKDDKCEIKILEYKVAAAGSELNQYGNKPAIIFWYEVTNINDETLTPSVAWILRFEAVQDNDPNAVNKLEIGMAGDPELSEASYQTVKIGGTVKAAISYSLDDETTPVTLTAKDLLGKEYGTQEFKLT